MNGSVVVRSTPGDGPHFGIVLTSDELRFVAKIHGKCRKQADAVGFFEAADVHEAVRKKLLAIAGNMQAAPSGGAAAEPPPMTAGDYALLAALHEILASVISHVDVEAGRGAVHNARSTELRAVARRARFAESRRGAP